MAQQWMSIVEYARTFAISDMTVRRRIRTGKLGAELREGKYFIPVDTDSNGNPVRGQPSISPLNHQPHVAPTRATPDLTTQVAPAIQRQVPLSSPEPKIVQQTRSLPSTPHIPATIASKIMTHAKATADALDLIEFCNNAITTQKELTKQTIKLHEQKEKTLTAQNETQTLEIQQLRQQVEDLQLLVQVLEQQIQQ